MATEHLGPSHEPRPRPGSGFEDTHQSQAKAQEQDGARIERNGDENLGGVS
jgi:hypothetical protein